MMSLIDSTLIVPQLGPLELVGVALFCAAYLLGGAVMYLSIRIWSAAEEAR